MNLDFEHADVEGLRLLSVKTVTDEEHFGAHIAHVIESIFKAVNGWADGPPVCVYAEGYDPEQVVAIAGVPYRGDPLYGFDTTELPPCRAVVAHHRGPYHELGDAWRETMAYLERNGLQMTGPPYERYVASTATELVVPVG